ncbi:MAG: protease pro-enzyme activation domain-containing protein [Acidobacteriaceae bacterium]
MIPRMFRTLNLIVFVSAVSLVAPIALQAQAQASPSLVVNRLTQPIDNNVSVTLKGTVHPLANAMNDRGAVPASMPLNRIQIVLKRSAAQEAALQQLIHDQNTPGSASYHKWLTPAEFGQQFGPSDQDVATLEAWLQSQGFNIEGLKPGRQTLEVSGSASQFQNAFHAQIHKYMVNGETHFANATNPQIPAALAPVFGGFASLNDFRPKRMSHVLGQATYNPKTGTAVPQWTMGSAGNLSFVVSPADFAKEYDLPSSLNGAGQTIAIINDANINIGFVNQFRTTFNLPANPPQVIIDGNDPGVDGINNPDGPNYDSIEAYVDVEWAGAVAPAATVDLVIGADTALESGLVLAAEHAVYGNIAPVMSLSFGYCEEGLGSENAFINSLWEQAAAQGITVMVSTGDSGSAGCDDSSQPYAVGGAAVSGFASTPYNVAVGGTDFYYSSWNQGASAINSQLATYWDTTPSNGSATASIKGYIPEQPWNDSQYGLNLLSYYNSLGITTIGGGGGGPSTCATGTADPNTGEFSACSAGYAKPPWQTGVGVPSDKVRDLPDVSLFAADGVNQSFYPLCGEDGDCQPAGSGGVIQITGAGGTSFASPAFAGIMALVNQKYGRQGQADTVLYPLATQFPAAFHDATNGSNSVPCEYLPTAALNCIKATNPITLSGVTEGQIGSGTTPWYSATTGYDLASGLGSVDANVLINDWGSVTFAGTTVSLTSPTTGASITHGTSVSFKGTVSETSGSATPTGNVAIETDSTEPVNQGEATFALNSSGAFSGAFSYLPGGTYNVWANYGGDSANAGAASQKVQLTISPEASTTYFNILDVATPYSGSVAITPGTTGIPYGTQLILDAEPVPTTYYNQCITPSNPPASCSTPTYTAPTGTVVFADNGGPVNTAGVNAEGDAEYNAPWPVGSHSVTAAYSGDNSYNKSTGSAITFSVAQDTPDIEVLSAAQNSAGSFIGSQSTVVTVLIENSANLENESTYEIGYSVPVASPTGTVTVTGLPGGPKTVSLAPAVDPTTYSPNGVATIILPPTSATGTFAVTISYTGDGNYTATSGSGTVTIVASSGLPSTTTATVTGSISPTTSITVTGSVTGQSGHAAPTGAVVVYSSGYNATEFPLVPGAGDVSTFSGMLNSQTLWQGTNVVTLQYTGDATYGPSSFPLASPIASPLSDFSMVPNTTIVPVAAGSSATDAIQLASINGFAGTVNYTCSAASGITCSLSPNSTTFTSGANSTTTLNVTAAAGTANGNYNVLLTGADSTGKYVHTLGIEIVVRATSGVTGSFTLTPSPTSLTLAAGATTGNTSTISVTPTGGFTGTVSFTCAVTTAPSGATDSPTCSAPSASVTGTTAATSTLTVATTAATSSASHNPLNKFFAAGGGVVIAGLLFFGIPARRRKWRSILVILVFAGIAGLGIGCGSGGGSSGGGGGGGGTTGTTAGAYVLTVTGTSGTLTQTTTVNLTVN